MKCRILILLFSFSAVHGVENNVCSNIFDYKNLQRGQSCYYNPDVDTTPDLIALNHGFNFQSHRVETRDGYFLNLYRIRDKRFIPDQPQVILLHHGLLSSALGFMITGNRSLAFYLARRGFDVWLMNNRGSTYSNGHAFLKQTDPKFWDISVHEIANYDAPSCLEHIYGHTQQKIIYLGHSLGTMSSFIYASSQREHAEKYLKGIVAVSPVASLTHYQSPLKRGVHQFRLLLETLRNLGVHSLFDNLDARRNLFRNTCKYYPYIEICRFGLFLLQGWNFHDLLSEDLPAILSYHPARSSLKSLLHLTQMIDTKRFQYFDYGAQRNAQKYNSTVPPLYRLEDVQVPVHIFYGENDHFSGKKDAFLIFHSIYDLRKSISAIPLRGKVKYNHVDFLFGKTVVENFYTPLLSTLNDL